MVAASLLLLWLFVMTFGIQQARSLPTTPFRDRRYFAQDVAIAHLLPIPPNNNNNKNNNNHEDTTTTTTTTRGTQQVTEDDLIVRYTNDPKSVSNWLSDHVPINGCTLGFDLESVPDVPWLKKKVSFKGPAVVQLATGSHALVIHLAKPSGRPSRACVPLVEAVLNDESIVKAGCSVDQDMMELYHKYKSIQARSRLDLGRLGASSETLGLRTLVASILGLDLPKSRRLAVSNWSQVPLSEPQLAYCARDAWAGAAIVNQLAAHEPEIFSSHSMTRRLRSQASMKELVKRQRKRKQAKMMLSAVLAPYSISTGTKEPIADIPPWKLAIVNELKEVMKENRYRYYEIADVDLSPLGLSIFDNNQRP